ncbi:MAG: hypothetical protein ACREID_04365 [Planctomycetota bacterium]
MRRAILFALLLASGCDTNAERAIEMLESLFSGESWEAAATFLESEAGDALADDPDTALAVCSRAARSGGDMGDVDEKAKPLVDIIVELGAKAATRSPKSAVAHSAQAEAFLCQGRFLWAAGKCASAESWTQATDCLERAYELNPGQGEALARAVEVLLEARTPDAAGREQVLGRAAALAQKARAGHAMAKPGLLAASSVDLERARHFAQPNPKAAKGHLQSCLDYLKPEMDVSQPDMELAAKYTHAVTFSKLHRKTLGIAAEYKLATHKTGKGHLSYSIPVSALWRNDRGAAEALVVQSSAQGRTVRSISVHDYDWGTNYHSDTDGSVAGGDNLKGLIKQDMGIAKKDFSRITAQKKLVKGRLNGAIPNAFSYEITGLDEDGDAYRLRSYYFKGDHHQVTYNVYVREWGDRAERDPEMDAVLDSFRELK